MTSLADAVSAAQREVEELLEAGDAEAAAYHWLRIIGPARQNLNDLYRDVEVALYEIAPWSGGMWQPEGLPILQARQGADRKSWRWDELRGEMRKALLDPKRNGGTILSVEQASVVDEVLDLVFEVAPLTPSTGPRIKPLRDRLGIDPDEYAEVKPGRVSVQVHQGDAA